MTAIELVYSMFENHDERVFLDFLRENKALLFKKEQEQTSLTKQEQPKQAPQFKAKTGETNL